MISIRDISFALIPLSHSTSSGSRGSLRTEPVFLSQEGSSGVPLHTKSVLSRFSLLWPVLRGAFVLSVYFSGEHPGTCRTPPSVSVHWCTPLLSISGVGVRRWTGNAVDVQGCCELIVVGGCRWGWGSTHGLQMKGVAAGRTGWGRGRD